MPNMQLVSPKKLIAVSDIHGRYDALRLIIREEDLQNGYKVVFMGDYFGYGDQSIEVIKYIWSLKEKYPEQIIVLYGNWEDMLYEALYSKSAKRKKLIQKVFAQRGWAKGFNKVKADKDVCAIIKSFPETLGFAFMDGSYCFSHAGVSIEAITKKCDIRQVVKVSTDNDLLWNMKFIPQASKLKSPYRFVVGHTPVQYLVKSNDENSIKPLAVGCAIGIDMGASKKKGFLGYIRFNEDGERTFAKAPSLPKPISKPEKVA